MEYEEGNMTTDQTQTRTEEFRLDGEEAVAQVKELIREGEVRRITLRNKEGKTKLDMSLTGGVFAAVFAPRLLVVLAALLWSGYTLLIEKVDEYKSPGEG
jgi:hypothetical protein